MKQSNSFLRQEGEVAGSINPQRVSLRSDDMITIEVGNIILPANNKPYHSYILRVLRARENAGGGGWYDQGNNGGRPNINGGREFNNKERDFDYYGGGEDWSNGGSGRRPDNNGGGGFNDGGNGGFNGGGGFNDGGNGGYNGGGGFNDGGNGGRPDNNGGYNGGGGFNDGGNGGFNGGNGGRPDNNGGYHGGHRDGNGVYGGGYNDNGYRAPGQRSSVSTTILFQVEGLFINNPYCLKV